MKKQSSEALISSLKNQIRKRINDKLNKQNFESKYTAIDAVIDELAILKAELLETSIDYQQIAGIEFLRSLKYSSLPGVSNFPIFSAGSKLDICSDVIVFNMHSPIKTNQGYLVRWSGPEEIFGFLSRIDRSEDLNASLPILSKANNATKIDLIEIDGNPVQIMQEPKRINFSLAKRSNNSLGDLTNFTFRVGPTASTGETSVGVCLKYLELEKA